MSNELLSRLQEAKTDEEREWIVLKFSLQNLEKEIQDAVWASAIPHWFDETFLAVLLDKPVNQTSRIYKRLKGLSFIEIYPGRGQNVHERTRKLLLNHLWQDEPERFRELSRHSAKYSTNQEQSDVSWRVEWVYHLLIANPEEGALQIQNVGWEWNNAFAYNKVEALVRSAREHLDAGRLTAECSAWVQYWDALVELDYFRYTLALDKFKKIQLSEIDNKHLIAEVSHRLGTIHIILGEYEKAQNFFEKALPACREIGYRIGEANCLLSLGDVFLKLSNYDESRKYYVEALSIYNEINDRIGQANATQNIGFVDKILNNDESALEFLYKALEIQLEIGDRVGENLSRIYLGDIDKKNKKWLEAEKKYLDALTYYREFNIQYNIAITLYRLGDLSRDKLPVDLKAARRYFQEALQIFTEIGSPHANDVLLFLNSLPPDS